MKKYTPLILCLICLSGCSIITVKERSDLAMQLPEKFVAARDMRQSDSLYWQDSFQDKHLLEDITSLYTNSFQLEAALARIEQAMASYGLSRSELFPSIDANSDFERKSEKEDTHSQKTSSNISFGSALRWELDVWGRLHAKKEAASLNLQEQKALFDQVELDLQTLLVESWVSHHTSRMLESVIHDQEITNTQFLELTELRLSQGQGSSLDVLQQRGQLVSIKRALPSVRADKIAAANAYYVLLGIVPQNDQIVLKEWPKLLPFSSLPSPSSLLQSRPDLRAAFLSLLAEDQEVAAAIADRLPRLTIGVNYNISGDSLSNIGDGYLLNFTSGLFAPIFDAGKRKAEVSRRKAKAREALANLEQAMLVALREIEDGLVFEQALFEEQYILNEELAIAQDTIIKAELRYVNGQENYLSVLNALENEQTLHQRSISLEGELLINRARLLKAFGAKWDL